MMQSEDSPQPAGTRIPLSARIRFEVLKRDRFSCQYCGGKAPDVLLQVDHITPVVAGGTNDLVNLITSCQTCNGGKGRRLLSDHTLLDRTRLQLEELEARREQIEMMLQWHASLGTLEADTIQQVCDFWHGLAPGFVVNDSGKKSLRQWLARYSLDEVLTAMRTSASQYLEVIESFEVTPESWDLAFGKIPGICRVTRLSHADPGIRELYYIRGILRKRLNSFNPARAMQWLEAARSWGVPLSRLTEMARTVRNWPRFSDAIDELIDEYKDDVEPPPGG